MGFRVGKSQARPRECGGSCIIEMDNLWLKATEARTSVNSGCLSRLSLGGMICPSLKTSYVELQDKLGVPQYPKEADQRWHILDS